MSNSQQQNQSAANVLDCQKEQTMNTQNLTILYARLSREDGEDGISNSIKNQYDFLTEYAERNGFTPYKFVQDDGYSGTCFSRPGWNEVIADIEAGKVSTLISKDSSRLFRDYIKAGMYREMFAERKVRLICVNDGIDTAVRDDDFTPFREVMNEFYAKDCSKKIRAVFKNRMQNGKRCSGTIPYGYIRKDGDVNDLIIDEEAAVNVRRIFQMIIEGMGVCKIAETFQNEKIPTPSEHFKKIGIEVRKSTYDDPYYWHTTTVSKIINRPEYKGTLVLGKTRNTSYKGKKAVETAPDEQYVFENALPVIVDASTWETAQRLKRTVRRAPKVDSEPNPLTGILYCADCHTKMSHRRSKNKQGYRENAYGCALNRRGAHKSCSLHYISSVSVEKLVLDVIRRVTNYVRDDESGFIEKVRELSELRAENDVKENRKLLVKSQRRNEELNTLITKLYEDNATGKIPDKHFDRMFAQYDAEQIALESKIAELQTQIERYMEDSTRADKFIELAKKYTEFDELTTPVFNEFIDRIDIHEADKSSGKRTQQVDIYLNFIGNFDVPDDYYELLPDEHDPEAERRAKLDKRNAYERERRRKKKAETNPPAA